MLCQNYFAFYLLSCYYPLALWFWGDESVLQQCNKNFIRTIQVIAYLDKRMLWKGVPSKWQWEVFYWDHRWALGWANPFQSLSLSDPQTFTCRHFQEHPPLIFLPLTGVLLSHRNKASTKDPGRVPSRAAEAVIDLTDFILKYRCSCLLQLPSSAPICWEMNWRLGLGEEENTSERNVIPAASREMLKSELSMPKWGCTPVVFTCLICDQGRQEQDAF